jgi:GNAT superfamily N-acetyltransferase
LRVIIRPFWKQTDAGLLVDTWPKNVFHSSVRDLENSEKDWFAEMYFYVLAKLETANILIACFEQERNLIAGYAVFDGDCLEFIWVKPRYREAGIGGLLLSRVPITHYNPRSLTKQGQKLIQEYGLTEKPHEETGNDRPSPERAHYGSG